MPKEIRTLKDKQTAIIQRMQIVAPLWRQNYSEREIRVEVMKRLGLATLSSRTVHEDIKRLLKEYQEQRIEDTEAKVTAELARLDLVIQEAWKQWEDSKEDKDIKRTRRKGLPRLDADGKEDGLLTAYVEQVRDTAFGKGDPRYLDIILKALEQRRRLLGLDRVQVDLTGTLGGEIEIRHTTTGYRPATSEAEVRTRDGIKEE
jgi:hypothetical protein